MSHDHKELVRSETNAILSKRFIYTGNGSWRRKTESELETPIIIETIPKKTNFWKKLMTKIKGEL